MKSYLIALGLTLATASSSLVAAQGTQWSTIDGTDSFGADVYPEGFTGSVDPTNTEQECKSWCLSVATCTMFLYYTGNYGICYIKTGNPSNVEYQYGGPTAPYNLVIRDMNCPTALALTGAYLGGMEGPACTATTGNNAEGTDEVPQGSLNAECLDDNTCLNGNVCDSEPGAIRVCKAPLGGNCRELPDCSNTITDPDLECTLTGGTNDNRICAVVAAVEPPSPGASQLAQAQRKKRSMLKALSSRSFANQCPKKTIACPTVSGNNFECVNANEELGHCGACGNNCLHIEGVHDTGVMCSSGQCQVYRCRKGYKLVNNTCVLV